MTRTSHGVICLAAYRPDPVLFAEQLRSIQTQRLGDFCCLIGADGDDREVRSLVHEVVGDDQRFHVVGFADRVGFYRNFERLLTLVPTSAAWVALSDQDDVWHADKLEYLVPLLEVHDVALCQARVVGQGRPSGIPTARRGGSLIGLVAENQVTGSLAVMRRDLLETALPFPAPTAAAFHDHWIALCAHVGKGIAFSPRVLQDYVQHEGQVQGEDEPDAVSAFRRLRGSGSARRSLSVMVAELVESRFGWRRRMCAELLLRRPDLAEVSRRRLRSVARPSPGSLAVALARSVRLREVPVHRATAMLASSMIVRVLGSRGGR